MGSTVRQGSKSVYYLDPAHAKSQQIVGGGGGGIKCVPVQGSSGLSKNTAYCIAPSSLQGGRVLQPVAGTTIVGGLQCDNCPPQCRLQKGSPDGARYGGAAATHQPQIVRVVPQSERVFLEEVRPSSPQRSSRSARQKLPNVMEILEDHDWYNKLAPAETSESEVAVEPEACRDCIEELMRRRRSPDPGLAMASSPVYVTKVPKSKRSCSRRFSPSPQRSLSRGGPSPTSSPRCSTCTACKSCGTVRSDSKPNTSRSRSRRWYE